MKFDRVKNWINKTFRSENNNKKKSFKQWLNKDRLHQIWLSLSTIYKYTMQKYLKSYSTWIIMAFSAILIGFVIGGIVPFATLDLHNERVEFNYTKAIIAVVAGITTFFAIFSAVFAGFKSSTMYRDEIENGTFLVILSKPITRSQIMIGKWFALQTILLIYAFVSVLFLCAGVAIFDVGGKIPSLKTIGVKPLSSQIWYIGFFIFAILYVTSLIFSSIGLIISTKISSGATIGIITAIGVCIPISGLIPTFAAKHTTAPTSADRLVFNKFASILDKQIDGIGESATDLLPPWAANVPNLSTNNILQYLKNSPFLKSIYQGTDNILANSENVNKSLYNVSISTGDNDQFKYLWWLDFNYQLSLLSGLAYENAIPDEVRMILSAGSTNALGNLVPTKIMKTDDISAEQIYLSTINFYKEFYQFNDNLQELSTRNTFQLEIPKVIFDASKENIDIFDTKALNVNNPLDGILWVSITDLNKLKMEFENMDEYYKDPANSNKHASKQILEIESEVTNLLKNGQIPKDLKDPTKQIFSSRIVPFSLYSHWMEYLLLNRDPNQNFVDQDLFNFNLTNAQSRFDSLKDIADGKPRKSEFFFHELVSKKVLDNETGTYDEKFLRAELFNNLDLVNSFRNAARRYFNYINAKYLLVDPDDIPDEDVSKITYLKTILHKFDSWSDISNVTTNPYATFFVNEQKLDNTMSDQIIQQVSYDDVISNYAHYDNSGQNPPFDPDMSIVDARLLAQYVSAAESGILNRYSASDYTSRTGLSVFYILFAFALLPLTYLVLRKQDIR